MVFQQIHFVDVQKAAVGLGQEAGGELLDALRQGFFQVECADHAVFGGTQRQVDDRHRAFGGFGFVGFQSGAVFAAAVLVFGRAAVRATQHDLDGRQQVGQRPHGGGFAGAPVAQHQHATDRGVDGDHLQRHAHFILTHDGRKGEGFRHRRSKYQTARMLLEMTRNVKLD